MPKPNAARAALSVVEQTEVFNDLGEVNYAIPPRRGVVVKNNGRCIVSKATDEHATALLRRLRYIPDVMGSSVLIGMFIRPNKVGSIYLADRSRDEDVYQGRVGLVLALGPLAFVDDKFRRFGGPWCRPGDWILYPSYENAHTRFEFPDRETVLATLVDDTARVIVRNPMDAR